FFQETLLRTSVEALARLAADTARWNLVLSVGLPLVVDDLLFNCAVTLYGGRPVAVAPKAYPPNYREFYELRWFHPAAEARATEVTLLGHRVPFGTDVLVRATHLPGFVLHTDICEDLWTPVPPGTLAALSGATVLGNLSASNVTVAKWEYRRELVQGSAAKNLAVQIYGAAGFGESTSDLAWDGHGIIADRGDIAAETERFVLGVSGGRDSTLALIVAVRALELMELPRANLIGITMPGFGTTEGTLGIARDLIGAFGATFREIDISEPSELTFAAIGHDSTIE